MAIKKFTVEVLTTVEVTIDDQKLDQEFMDDFSRYFYELDTLEEHACYLAQLEAREMIGWDDFVEGYGDLKELGIELKVIDRTEEVI